MVAGKGHGCLNCRHTPAIPLSNAAQNTMVEPTLENTRLLSTQILEPRSNAALATRMKTDAKALETSDPLCIA